MTVTLITPEDTAFEQRLAESIVAEPPTEMKPGLDERVQRGVDLLDEEYPGWAEKIDLERFNIKDPTRCVIGQVFGRYYDHYTDVLGIPHSAGCDPVEEEHGFNLDRLSRDDEEIDFEWSQLEASWRTAIRERQRLS